MITKYILVLMVMVTAFEGMAQSNLSFTNKELDYHIKPDEIEQSGRRTGYTIFPERLPKIMPPDTIRQGNGSQKIIYKFSSGNIREESILIHGKKNGTSIIYYENGNVQQRIPYKDDLIDGQTIYNAENGELVVSTMYSKGKRNGDRTLYYNSKVDPAKRIYAVTPYKNDLIDGVVVMYKLESQEYFLCYKASFKAGLPDGIWETFDRGYVPSSTGDKYLRRVVYKETEEWNSHGKKSGIHKHFRPDGSLKTASAYVKDTIQYIECFDRKGKSLWTNKYDHGKGVGLQQYFHDNGQLRTKFLMENGERVGELLRYYDNGQLEEKAAYEHDKQIGPYIKYYENGNKEKEAVTGKQYLSVGEVTEYFRDGGIRSVSVHDEKGKMIQEAHYDQYGKKKKIVMIYFPEMMTEYYDSSNHLLWTNHYVKGKKIGLYKHYDYQDRLITQSYDTDNKTGYLFQFNEYNRKIISEKYTINGATVTKETFLNQYTISDGIVTAKTGN